MSDKFEALKAAALAATPGPWYRSSVLFNGVTSEQAFMHQGNKPHIANAGEKRDATFIAAASPDVVLSLLAALEDSNQRADRLNGMLDSSMRATKATEQREEHLKADVDVMGRRIADLENDEVRQRLANADHQLYLADLAKFNLRANRKAQFRKRREAERQRLPVILTKAGE